MKNPLCCLHVKLSGLKLKIFLCIFFAHTFHYSLSFLKYAWFSSTFFLSALEKLQLSWNFSFQFKSKPAFHPNNLCTAGYWIFSIYSVRALALKKTSLFLTNYFPPFKKYIIIIPSRKKLLMILYFHVYMFKSVNRKNYPIIIAVVVIFLSHFTRIFIM